MLDKFIKEYSNSQLRKLKGVYCFTFPNNKRYVGDSLGFNGKTFAAMMLRNKEYKDWIWIDGD
jgi:hypothetical protein